MKQTDTFNKKQLKTLPELRPGYTVAIHQKIKEGNKERIQVFKGVIIAAKHGKGINGTITVRKVSSGIGVERILPIHMPSIQKIEILGVSKVRRAKLYYLRERSGKKARLKRKEGALETLTVAETPEASKTDEQPAEETPENKEITEKEKSEAKEGSVAGEKEEDTKQEEKIKENKEKPTAGQEKKEEIKKGATKKDVAKKEEG